MTARERSVVKQLYKDGSIRIRVSKICVGLSVMFPQDRHRDGNMLLRRSGAQIWTTQSRTYFK